MAVEIAGVVLNRVHRLQTLEQSQFVHHPVPGMQGTVVQNLGRDRVRLQLQGIFYGDKALENLETLRKIYKDQQPVDFLADVVGQAYFSQVILEQFEVTQAAQEPDQFSYVLAIAEYTPSAIQPTATASVNSSIQRDAAGFMTAAMLPDALQIGAIPTITNPVEPLKASLDPIKATITTLDSSLDGLKELFQL
jgi:hypothetical protein